MSTLFSVVVLFNSLVKIVGTTNIQGVIMAFKNVYVVIHEIFLHKEPHFVLVHKAPHYKRAARSKNIGAFCTA